MGTKSKISRVPRRGIRFRAKPGSRKKQGERPAAVRGFRRAKPHQKKLCLPLPWDESTAPRYHPNWPPTRPARRPDTGGQTRSARAAALFAPLRRLAPERRLSWGSRGKITAVVAEKFHAVFAAKGRKIPLVFGHYTKSPAALSRRAGGRGREKVFAGDPF